MDHNKLALLMAARRERARQRILRSPIEPGSIQVSAKTLLSMIPLVLVLLALTGSWYVQKDRQDTMKRQIEDLQDSVASMALENAADAGNGLVLEKLRDDVSTIKTDLARIRAKLE